MAKFSIATTEKYKNKEGELVSNTDWHNIVLWRRTAEVAEKYLKKGDSICIEGKIKTRSWEDENGVKKYATDIQGDSMTMLGSKREGNSEMGYQNPKDISNNKTEDNMENSAKNDLPFS